MAQAPKSLVELGLGNLTTNEQEEKDLLDFLQSERNFLIMTSAGKPVYCHKGDIQKLSSLFATLYAIISKIQDFAFCRDVLPPKPLKPKF